jgi:hypothetical protein
MAWAFVQYPWHVLLEEKLLWNQLPSDISPDNGAGILFRNENELPTSLRLFERKMGPDSFFEIAGPSLREDGFKDLSLKLSPDLTETVIGYNQDCVADSNPLSLSAQFHDALTNSLQEFSDILFEERKRFRDKFHEKTLHETLKRYFNSLSDDFAFRALICDIAEEIPPAVEAVVVRPRKFLRRRHTQVGLDRLQEMDIASLMDYARRPGDSALIKAGDRQTLMAVVREETPDTLENRVVKDFCRRARKTAELYSEECCWSCRNSQSATCETGDRKCRSRRVQNVKTFANRCDQWLMAHEFATVSSIQVPCRIPNYALLQNVRYVQIWDYYQRLLMQEDVRDQTWIWKRQAWTDYVRILMMQTMSRLTLKGLPPAFQASAKPARLRRHPSNGTWIKSEPFDGPIVFESDAHFVSLYLLNHADADRMFTGLPVPLAALNADCYWIAVSTEWSELRVIPIWSFVGDSRWHGPLASEMRSVCLRDIANAASAWRKKSEERAGSQKISIRNLVVVKPSYSRSTVTAVDGEAVFIETPLSNHVGDFLESLSSLLQEVIQ